LGFKGYIDGLLNSELGMAFRVGLVWFGGTRSMNYVSYGLDYDAVVVFSCSFSDLAFIWLYSCRIHGIDQG
jgi:hypothetical protein